MKITGSLLVSGGLFPQVYSPTSSLTPSTTVSVNFTSASIFELTPNANTIIMMLDQLKILLIYKVYPQQNFGIL